MSHLVELKAAIKDLEVLGRVAKKLGTTLVVGKSKIVDYYSKSHDVDAKLTLKDSAGHECIGFKKQGNEYKMLGDLYQVKQSDKNILDKIAQNYAIEVTKKKMLEQGFVVASSKEVNGVVQVTYSK